jgi:hypothetical protein
LTREALGLVRRAVRCAWRSLPPRQRREAAFYAISLIAPRPALRKPTTLGTVTVAGFLSLSSGLGQGARLMLQELRDAGIGSRG